MLSKENIQYIYPLTPLQEGIYFHSLLHSHSNAYLIQASYEVQGEIDVAVMEKSFHLLLQRHDVLRTVFVQKNAHRTLQVVLKSRKPDFVFRDLSAVPDKEQRKEACRKEDKNRRFDLNRDVLMRVVILKLEERRYEIIWTYHHIIMDGWCIPVLVGEFYTIYYSLLQGRQPRLPAVKPYREYIQWLEKQDKEASKHFWEGYLDGFDTATVIHPTRPADRNAPYLPASHTFGFSPAVTQALIKLATRYQVTMNVLIQAIWGILLGRYNGVRDVVFGTVVSGRAAELEDVGSMIGLFINTIPVRISYGADDTFADLLGKAKRNAMDSVAHECYPLVEIQASTPLRQHLLDHILVFYNYPIEKQLENLETGNRQGGFIISRAAIAEHDSYHFNFNIVLEDTLSFHLDYNGNVFHESFIRGIAEDFTALTGQILEEATVVLDTLQLAPNAGPSLPAAGTAPVRDGVTIHGLFERQAALHPEANAVIAGNTVLTFRQLNQKANQLARYLREGCQLGPGDLVGVLLDRSERMIIAILGILKAGATFLPIDPSEAKDRRDFVLADSDAKVLLTESAFLFRVERFRGSLFAMDIQLDGLPTSKANLGGIRPPGSLAYIIYTSGSTGKPKGVLIPESALANYADWFTESFAVSPRDSSYLLSSFAFDLGYTSVWGTLLNGACLHILPADYMTQPEKLLEHIAQQRITFIKTTPSLFNLLVQSPAFARWAPHLNVRLCLLGGEPIKAPDVAKYLQVHPQTVFVNHYGPTETTIGAITHQITAATIEEFAQQPIIGKPITGNYVTITDESLRRLPPGVPGELCIGGAGVTRGYLNNSALTETRLVTLPGSSGENPVTWYRTGDLARWLPDGVIEFLGRRDSQVKLRGFRVELAEVEAVMETHPSVSKAVVLARPTNHAAEYLACFFTARRPLKPELLRSFLAERLPDYMIPASFTAVDHLPTTTNGKLDGKALAALDRAGARQSQYVQPRNVIEENLARIWESVLGKEQISVNDNFFELGGHSLKVVQILNLINEQYPSIFQIGDLFSYATVASQANEIIRGGAGYAGEDLIEIQL